MDMELRLQELKREKAERDPKGWDDYQWAAQEGDFTDGQISILEELLNPEDDAILGVHDE